MSMYSSEESAQVKHVLFDNTAAVRKDWLASHDLPGPFREP
jgi:hypothetical protein